MKKILGDSNIQVVLSGIRIIGGLAKNMRK